MYQTVKEIKMEVVLFSLQKQDTRLWPTSNLAWTLPGLYPCLPVSTPVITRKSGSTSVKRGSVSWNFLSPWRSGKSCDSQDEINSIVKVKGKPELRANWWWYPLCPEIINRSHQICNLKSHSGVDALPGTLFPAGTPDCCYSELSSSVQVWT